MPDLNLNAASAQCFPRYRYPKPADTPDSTDTFQVLNEASGGIDNISDTALGVFREHYRDDDNHEGQDFRLCLWCSARTELSRRIRKRFVEE